MSAEYSPGEIDTLEIELGTRVIWEMILQNRRTTA